MEKLVNDLIGPPRDHTLQQETLNHSELKSINQNKPNSKERESMKLSTQDYVLFDIPPSEKILYSKDVQTDFQDEKLVPELDHLDVNDSVNLEESLPAGNEQICNPTETQLSESVNQEPPQLDISNTLSSESFNSFFMKSCKLVDRALNLNENYDIFTDYLNKDEIEDCKINSNGSKGWNLTKTFSHERYSKNRCCTDLDWSPKYPELVLASFSKNSPTNGNLISEPLGNNDADGVTLIYNLHSNIAESYLFSATSDITSCMFSPFHSRKRVLILDLVISGTYSGQVLIFDVREGHYPGSFKEIFF